jgi:hypothetical protein
MPLSSHVNRYHCKDHARALGLVAVWDVILSTTWHMALMEGAPRDPAAESLVHLLRRQAYTITFCAYSSQKLVHTELSQNILMMHNIPVCVCTL